MTRIRYQRSKNSENALVSVKSILLPTGELITIVLNTATNEYKFINTATNSEVSSNGAETLSKLKKLVRNTLLSLGVNLEVEVKSWSKTSEKEAA